MPASVIVPGAQILWGVVVLIVAVLLAAACYTVMKGSLVSARQMYAIRRGNWRWLGRGRLDEQLDPPVLRAWSVGSGRADLGWFEGGPTFMVVDASLCLVRTYNKAFTRPVDVWLQRRPGCVQLLVRPYWGGVEIIDARNRFAIKAAKLRPPRTMAVLSQHGWGVQWLG